MIWFEGSIANAVQTSKSKNAIFVVYVEGKDDNSNKMTEMINHPNASSKLESDKFVAVKLEAGSESYNQFVQIYQLVPVPSLFFIGKNGAPIEVIPQHLENEEFLSKIEKIMETANLSIAPTPQAMASTSSSNLINSEKKITASTSAEQTINQPKPAESNRESSPETPKPTVNEINSVDKIERAKQLIEEKREKKRIEEEEEQRKKEVERRKMGQEIQKMRRQQQDEERKQIREEILREKNEELAARQKILAQIEQDKQERAKKFNQQSTSNQSSEASPLVEQPKCIPKDTNSARLQFRFADGTSHTKDFVPTNTLEEVRSYVQQNLNLPYRNFDLSTTFPRRQFSVEDNTRTLADLELIPNAVILVVPVTGRDVTPASPVPGMISSLIWLLLSPIVGIYNFVYTRYDNWRNPRPAPFKRPSDDNPPGGSSNGPSYPKRRNPPDSTVIRRHGNIHRLGDRKEDSDEDNNTWNGNSTQQM